MKISQNSCGKFLKTSLKYPGNLLEIHFSSFVDTLPGPHPENKKMGPPTL